MVSRARIAANKRIAASLIGAGIIAPGGGGGGIVLPTLPTGFQLFAVGGDILTLGSDFPMMEAA